MLSLGGPHLGCEFPVRFPCCSGVEDSEFSCAARCWWRENPCSMRDFASLLYHQIGMVGLDYLYAPKSARSLVFQGSANRATSLLYQIQDWGSEWQVANAPHGLGSESELEAKDQCQ